MDGCATADMLKKSKKLRTKVFNWFSGGKVCNDDACGPVFRDVLFERGVLRHVNTSGLHESMQTRRESSGCSVSLSIADAFDNAPLEYMHCAANPRLSSKVDKPKQQLGT